MSNVRSAVTMISIIAGVALLIFGSMRLRSVDPFEDYKKAFGTVAFSPNVVSLDDVDVSAWAMGKPLGKFHVNRLQVGRDENITLFTGCGNGMLYQDGKPSVSFSAGRVKWDASAKTAEVTEVARFQTDSLDVSTASLTWNETNGQVLLPMPIAGRLSNGKVIGQNATVYLKTGSVTVNGATWDGLARYSAQTKEKPRDRKVNFRAERIKRTSKPDVITYTNAEMVDDEDTFVRANSIVHNKETDIADCAGNCQMRSPRMDLTGDKAVVDLNVKKATLTVGIKATLWPKPADVRASKEKPKEGEEEDPLHDRKIGKGHPATVTCDQVEYLYGDERKAVLQGHLKARQDLPGGAWREVTADKAIIDEQNEIIRLEGHVHMVQSNGDEFDLGWVELSTKEDDDSFEAGGEAKGVFTVPKKEADKLPATGKKEGGGKK